MSSNEETDYEARVAKGTLPLAHALVHFALSGQPLPEWLATQVYRAVENFETGEMDLAEALYGKAKIPTRKARKKKYAEFILMVKFINEVDTLRKSPDHRTKKSAMLAAAKYFRVKGGFKKIEAFDRRARKVWRPSPYKTESKT